MSKIQKVEEAGKKSGRKRQEPKGCDCGRKEQGEISLIKLIQPSHSLLPVLYMSRAQSSLSSPPDKG
jgi:hypothetical protein